MNSILSAAPSLLSATTTRLQGKVALITGGASGVGKCTAKLFAKHGAKVAIADIQDELGQSVVATIGADIATYVHCNVTNEDDVKTAVDTVVSKYGKLDIMFNNSGTIGTPKQRIADNTKEDFEHVMSINVTGVFLGMKHAARVMVPARSGAIISTASVAASIAGTCSHAYTCSKHAVVGLTKSMAVELGQFGIRVNCVSPYGLATPLAKKFLDIGNKEIEERFEKLGNLKGVVLKAEDIANAAMYLASEESKYVSGLNLVVDGGVSVSNAAIQMFRTVQA